MLRVDGYATSSQVDIEGDVDAEVTLLLRPVGAESGVVVALALRDDHRADRRSGRVWRLLR
jgi:hypothetical protein